MRRILGTFNNDRMADMGTFNNDRMADMGTYSTEWPIQHGNGPYSTGMAHTQGGRCPIPRVVGVPYPGWLGGSCTQGEVGRLLYPGRLEGPIPREVGRVLYTTMVGRVLYTTWVYLPLYTPGYTSHIPTHPLRLLVLRVLSGVQRERVLGSDP